MSMDFKIRSFEFEDLDQIMAIEKASFPDPYRRLWFRILKYQVGDGFIVAQNDGIVGYAISERSANRGHIISMAVSPKYRRAGIGRALLQETLERLGPKAQEIYLEVREGNEAAIRLYKNFAFRKTGERLTRYYPDGEDAIIMSRPA